MAGRRHALVLSVTSFVISGVGGLIQARPAWAADPAESGANARTGATIEEIIVTAEKRSSKVQQTPIAITAVTSKALQEQHIEQVLDLGAVLPNVQMVPVAQTVQVNIRGVGSNFFDPRGETSVSSSIDGLSYARPAQAGATFFDINRIEVLNGPQGTLYGTNAAAGAVNVITNQPVKHYEAYGEVGTGNYSLFEYAGLVNLPITPDFSVRIAAKGVHHDGYVAKYYEDQGDNAVRGSAKWTPNADFKAYFSYNYAQSLEHGAVPVSYPCDPQTYSNVVSQRCAPPGAPGGAFGLSGKSRTYLQTYELALDYDLGFAKVTSISGFLRQSIDVANNPNGTFFNTTLAQASHDYSEEVRITGNDDGHHGGGFGWVTGAYYSTGNGSNYFAGLGRASNQTRLPEATEAGFGQGTYGITDTIRATVGIRYTHDDKGVSDINGSNLDVQYGHINYRAEIETDLTKNNLLYASVSTGYVAGGADGGIKDGLAFPGLIAPTFKPENILAYEAGSKTTFLNGALQVNGAFYYYIIKNYQSYIPGILNDGVLGLQIQDIANATTYGGEMSAAYALTADDRLTAAGSVAHGEFGAIKFDSFGFGPQGLAPTIVSVPAGYPLTNLPQWDLRLGYSHTWNLPNDATLEAGVNTHISGHYAVVPASNDPYDSQKSYTMTDLHIRYQMAHGLSIDGFVKNVENVEVTTYAENPGFHLYYPLPPRTYGVTLGYRFF